MITKELQDEMVALVLSESEMWLDDDYADGMDDVAVLLMDTYDISDDDATRIVKLAFKY